MIGYNAVTITETTTQMWLCTLADSAKTAPHTATRGRVARESPLTGRGKYNYIAIFEDMDLTCPKLFPAAQGQGFAHALPLCPAIYGLTTKQGVHR
ncbi:hypothetical protein NAC44_17150 [Allorhizobium sp. BGMRC 0089]|nr:hypothetical protein [Allorhizobium sonneratiae]